MRNLNMVRMGSRVKDRITGFQGTLTGRAEYISGCTQCLVAPTVKADGSFAESQWFDEQRLEVIDVKAAPIVLENDKTPGADIAAPKR
jgi:hypothetical protein